MMGQILKTDLAGIIVHNSPRAGAVELSLGVPAHVLLVDRDARALKATMMDTGQWLVR